MLITGNLLLELLDHRDIVKGLHFSPDGSLNLASVSCDGTTKLWDLDDDGNMYKTLRPGCKWALNCRWSHDNRLLVVVGSNKIVSLWLIKH